MGWLEAFLAGISSSALANPLLFFVVTIIATALWGDASMIALSILAIQFKIGVWTVLVGGYIGAMLGDIAWFILGKKILPKLGRHRRFREYYARIIHHINNVTHSNAFVTLCLAKFLYGTRVITVFYLAERKMKLLQFIKYNAVALILWVAAMGTIGYLVAKGFTFLVYTVKNVQLALTLLIIFFVLFSILQKKINKMLER